MRCERFLYRVTTQFNWPLIINKEKKKRINEERSVDFVDSVGIDSAALENSSLF